MAPTADDPTRAAEPEPEDVLADALQTLYDYTPITLASAGAEFRFPLRRDAWQGASAADTPPGKVGADLEVGGRKKRREEIVLTTPRTQAKNWALHADSVWTSAQFIASHVELLCIPAHIEDARARGQLPLRILELGAGAGLPSLVLAAMYEDIRVTASDYPDPELIRTLDGNVKRNEVQERCRAVPYAWGSDTSVFEECQGTERHCRMSVAKEYTSEVSGEGPARSCSKSEAGFDVVVAADTLWNPELHLLFLDTIRKTLRRAPESRAYLVAGLHTGRYTLRAFMAAVPIYGLALENVVEREANGDGAREWDANRAEGEDERERRRWVIEMVIKWDLE